MLHLAQAALTSGPLFRGPPPPPAQKCSGIPSRSTTRQSFQKPGAGPPFLQPVVRALAVGRVGDQRSDGCGHLGLGKVSVWEEQGECPGLLPSLLPAIGGLTVRSWEQKCPEGSLFPAQPVVRSQAPGAPPGLSEELPGQSVLASHSGLGSLIWKPGCWCDVEGTGFYRPCAQRVISRRWLCPLGVILLMTVSSEIGSPVPNCKHPVAFESSPRAATVVQSGPEIHEALPRGTGRSSKAAGPPVVKMRGWALDLPAHLCVPTPSPRGRHAEPLRGRFLSGTSGEAEIVATWEVRLCSSPLKEDRTLAVGMTHVGERGTKQASPGLEARLCCCWGGRPGDGFPRGLCSPAALSPPWRSRAWHRGASLSLPYHLVLAKGHSPAGALHRLALPPGPSCPPYFWGPFTPKPQPGFCLWWEAPRCPPGSCSRSWGPSAPREEQAQGWTAGPREWGRSRIRACASLCRRPSAGSPLLLARRLRTLHLVWFWLGPGLGP